jgi:hypothetical protein
LTSLGIPGRLDHRFFHETTRKVVKAWHKNGKTAVLGVTDADVFAHGLADGFRMLVCLTDIWIYQKGLRDCFMTIENAAAHRDKQH